MAGRKTYEGESLGSGPQYASYYLERFIVAFSKESYNKEDKEEYVLEDFIPDSEMPWKISEMSSEKFKKEVKRFYGPFPTLGCCPRAGSTSGISIPRDDDGHSINIWG